MNVLFVYPDIIKGDYSHEGKYYEGIGYLSAVLKEYNHQVTLIHLTKEIDRKRFQKKTETFSPDLVAFSATTNTYPYVKKYAKLVKECFSLPIICGGIHPTLRPEEVISDENIDFVCVGEGEFPLLELINRLEDKKDTRDIPSIWAKEGDKIYRNPCRNLIEDLDTLPFPDRTIFDFDRLVSSRAAARCFYFYTSRGCPYHCSYCCNPALKKTLPFSHNFFRYKSVSRLVEEIKGVIKRYGYIKSIAFGGDIFPRKKEWLQEFAQAYPRQIGLPFICDFHPLDINRETAECLKSASCQAVCIGLESGDDYILKDILKRNVTSLHIVTASKILKEARIRVITYNMVGLPFEESQQVLKTIKLNALIQPVKIRRTIFYPFPETELFEVCKKTGLLSERTIDSYCTDTILKLTAAKRTRILFFHRYMCILVKLYRAAKKIPGLEKTLDALLLSNKLPWGLLVSIHDALFKLALFVYRKFHLRLVFARKF